MIKLVKLSLIVKITTEKNTVLWDQNRYIIGYVAQFIK